MRLPISIVFSLALSFSAFALPKQVVKPLPSPEFEVIPLNSPVKESEAKFLLKIPSATQIHKVYYRLTNVFRPMRPEMQDKETDLKKIANGYELDVPVNSLKPGFYRIFVHIVDKTKNDHHFLRHNNDYAKFAIDPSMEVPAPDPKINNATLEGVDSDGDGIRDDVQRWINANFATKPNTKLAVKQLARSFQSSLFSAEDKASSIAATNKMAETISCLNWISSDDNAIEKAIRDMESLMSNTELRIKATIKGDEYYRGQSRPASIMNLSIEQRNALCDFEASKE